MFLPENNKLSIFVLLGVKILNFTQINLLPWSYKMFAQGCSMAHV